MELLTRGPLTDIKRLQATLDAHGISAEILRPVDCNLGS